MLSEAEALDRILAKVLPGRTEQVPLQQACARIAAADLHASIPIPRMDNSAMDGYALHAADCGKSGIELAVSGTQPAGRKVPGLRVEPGQTVRIFTGAPLPLQTAAILMQEDAETLPGNLIRVTQAASIGEFIRRQGADLCEGQKILTRGQCLTPAAIGLLASQGHATAQCACLPTVRIFATGSELVAPGTPLTDPGEIYNSNGSMLCALLQSTRTASVADICCIPDEPAALAHHFSRALEEVDILIVAGGVSVGEHDFTRPALEKSGAALDFWRINMKPGKPFLFGYKDHSPTRRSLVFGLPGNPVSAFVTTLLFVLPALRKFAGASDTSNHLAISTLTADVTNHDRRPAWLRGIHSPHHGTFSPLAGQESHALHTLAKANSLLRLEPGKTLTAGTQVHILPYA